MESFISFFSGFGDQPIYYAFILYENPSEKEFGRRHNGQKACQRRKAIASR